MALKHNTVMVCGHYGYQTNQICGQTIKTRVLKDAFVDFLGEANVQVVDSTMFFKHPIKFIFEARKGFKECSLVVMLPGVRGLRVFLPLFLYWKRKWQRQLQYVVIGGWLPGLLQRNRWLRNQCAQLDGIFVEMTTMAKALSGLGLLNVSVLPNFRKFDYEMKKNSTPTTIPLKLVVYSRIFREKGVEDALAALEIINEKSPSQPRAILDIYGPINELYQAEFQKRLIHPQYINYRGVLAPEGACNILRKYNLLLFPTYYEGEGFPGTLLDAYIAGLPVIASDWKYNREIVEEGSTGLLFRTHAVEEIVEHIEMFIANPSRIIEMRQHCIEKAQHYHVEDVVQMLLSGSTKF